MVSTVDTCLQQHMEVNNEYYLEAVNSDREVVNSGFAEANIDRVGVNSDLEVNNDREAVDNNHGEANSDRACSAEGYV